MGTNAYSYVFATDKLSPFEITYKNDDECNSKGKDIRKEEQNNYDLTFLLLNSDHTVLTKEMENRFKSLNVPIYPGWQDIPASGVDYEPLGGVMPENAAD